LKDFLDIDDSASIDIWWHPAVLSIAFWNRKPAH